MAPFRKRENKEKDQLRVHLRYDREKTRCGLKIKTWMKYPAKNVTIDPDKITCGVCKRSLKAKKSKKGAVMEQTPEEHQRYIEQRTPIHNI